MKKERELETVYLFDCLRLIYSQSQETAFTLDNLFTIAEFLMYTLAKSPLLEKMIVIMSNKKLTTNLFKFLLIVSDDSEELIEAYGEMKRVPFG